MAEYDVAKIQEKNTAKDRKNMTAQELAVLSNVYGINQVSTFGQPQAALESDQIQVDDTKSRRSQRAGWNSALDFLSGLFIWKEKIDFTVNGTQFTGRNGYQVRGGAVPVFDGVVVDFLPATLQGRFIDSDSMQACGKNAQLVIYPKNMDMMFSVALGEETIIGIDDNKPFIGGASSEPITIEQKTKEGKQISIHAEGLNLQKSPNEAFQDAKIELVNPVVDDAEETREVEEAEITSAGVVISYQEELPQKSEEIHELEEKENAEEEEAEEKADTEPEEETKEEPFSLSGFFDFFSLSSEDEEEDETKEEDENKEEDDQSVLNKIKEFWGDDANWEKMKFVRKALVQYFKTGTVPSLEDSPFGNLSDIDTAGETDISLKFPIIPGLNFTVGFEPGYEIKLSGKYILEEAENSAITIKDLGQNIEDLFSGKKDEKEKNRGLARIIDMAEGFKLKLGGGLKVDGSLALKFTAGLQADASYLFQADAKLYAEGKLQGREQTGLASADLSTTIGVEKGKLTVGDKVFLDLNSGLSFNASVGTEGKLTSRLFSWEKELWSKEFASISIFEVDMNSSLSAPISEGISGLKMVKSGISFKTMSGRMRQRNWDNLKLQLKEPSPVASMLIKSANNQMDDMDALILEYENLKKKTLTGDDFGNLSKQEGEESFQNLKNHFIQFTQSLKDRLICAKDTLENIQSIVNNMLQDDVYQSNLKKTEENIKKHEDRLNQMQEWSVSLQNGEGDVKDMHDSQAFAKYQEITGSKGAGMVSASKKNIKQQAKQNVATREKLLKYEKRRQIEILKDKEKLLHDLNEQMDTSKIDKNKNNQEFVKFYLKNAKGSGLPNQLSLYYRNKESLLKYEQGRLDEVTEKHGDRLKMLNDKVEREGIDKSAPNKAFVQYYEKELNAKEMLKHLINIKATSQGIIEYELSKVTETEDAKEYYNRIQELEKYKKLCDASASETEKQNVIAEARNYFFGKEDRKEVRKYSYKMASAKDLIEYEMNWKAGSKSKEKKSNTASKNYHRLHELISADARSGEIEQKGSDTNKTKLLTAMSEKGQQDLDKMIEKGSIDRDIIKSTFKSQLSATIENNISLETLLQFQINMQKNKKGDENTDKKIDRLRLCINNAREIKDLTVRQQFIEQIRARYFSGDLWRDVSDESDWSIKKEHNELIRQIKHQEINDAFVLHELWLKEYDQYYGSHKERANKMKKLQAAGLNDMQIWDSYKEMGAGKRFKEEWVRSHGRQEIENISIDQMIQYEKRKLRRETRQGWINQQMLKVKDEANGTLLAKGGHYQRLLSLMDWKDQEFKPGETKEEHEKEMIRRYQEELYGGGGYEEFLEENKYQLVTPEDILNYEAEKVREKGKKHFDRIDYIKTIKEAELSSEQMQKYRNMAMSDGESTKDKINNVLSQIYSGYSTGYDNSLNAESVLTPQMIMDYENDQKAEISRKHDERIKLLENQEISDDELWEKYQQMGGGKRFAKVNKDEISQESEAVEQNFYNYDNIIAYEKRRVDHYTTIRNSINEPIEEMRKKGEELQKKMEELEGIKDELSQVTPETFFLGNNALDDQVNGIKQKSTESKDILSGDMKQYETAIKKQVSELDDYLNDEEIEELLTQ